MRAPDVDHPVPAYRSVAVDVNPAAAVARNAREIADWVVIRYAGGDLTYREFDERSGRLARALREGGVAAGDRVAYVGLNSPTLLMTMIAAFRIGAVFVPVNFRMAGPEVRAVLDISGAAVVVAEEGHRDVVESIRAQTSVGRFLVVDDDPTFASSAEVPGWERTSTVLETSAVDSVVHPAGFDDPAMLLFTSGTTGFPKGVVLTHGNIWWNSVNVDSRVDTRRGDVTYAAAPLFHIGALNSFVIRTLTRGGTVVVQRSFEPTQFRDDLTRYRVNSMFAVPAMLAAFGQLPGAFDADLSALRSVVVAGAPVPTSQIRLFAAHGILLQQAWGLTETAPFATHLPAERTLDKVGSAGTPMPYTEVRVVDVVTGDDAAPGATGEIIVRGPNVTPGYWLDREATEAAFDREGWFHSGDVGYLDDDGYLFVVDRLKDMVISGGENVYPAEVERVIATMPEVRDVAVVGMADEKWGEIVTAVIAVESACVVTLDGVRDYAASELARYKLPRRLWVIDEIPRNATGKIVKTSLVALLGSTEVP